MDAKEKLADGLDWLKDQWLEFRERSGFFQAKVAVVGAYILVVVGTLVVFPVPPPNLNVTIQNVQFGVSERTVVVVRNLELGTIEKADFVVYGAALDIDGSRKPGQWKSKKNHYLDEREPVRLKGLDLKDEQGRTGPAAFELNRLEIYEDGSLIARWPRRSP